MTDRVRTIHGESTLFKQTSAARKGALESSSPQVISVRGATSGPLRGLDVEVGLEQLICLSGPAGSCARSLALDILLAESHRRYCAVLSPLDQRRLRAGAPADVDEITGLPPAVRLSAGQVDARMASATSVGGFLQVTRFYVDLFLRYGRISCPACGGRCESHDIASATRLVIQQQSSRPVLVIAPLKMESTSSPGSILEILQQSGFTSRFLGDQVVRFDQLSPEEVERVGESGELLIIIDRLRSVEQGGEQRLQEALRTARAVGRGRCLIVIQGEGASPWQSHWINQALTCVGCASTYADPTVDELLTTPIVYDIRPEHISVQECGLNDLLSMQIDDVIHFSTGAMASLADDALIEWHRDLLCMAARLSLGHLNLDSPLSQLSAGEQLRIMIAAAGGAGLAGILYVCDTPVSVLDEEAQAQTLSVLRLLVERGNTVILIDDDPFVHSKVDSVLRFARGNLLPSTHDERPDDGVQPGHGHAPSSARVVRDLPEIVISATPAPPLRAPIEVSLPPGRLTCVTGVSGSGKSAMLRQVMLPAFRSRSRAKAAAAIESDARASASTIRRVRFIGDETRRSEEIVVDTLGLFGKVAGLFAHTPVARERGYAADWFQLDRPGGRCPGCEGRGRVQRDMDFLDELDLPCSTCEGRRFQAEVLQITWRGRSMADILAMNAAEAADFFTPTHVAIAAPLATASSFGLEDCLMGDRSADLDESMALRVQLCAMEQRVNEKDLILLDSPASGVNELDRSLLLALLDQLCDRGTTVVIAETHREVVATAAHVITMGPGRGAEGGRVIA